jgi:hypothetical protein
MPEIYIIYRKLFEVDLGYTQIWQDLFRSLKPKELKKARAIIEENDFRDINSKTKNPKIRKLLEHYTISREDIKKSDEEHLYLKAKFDRLIKKDNFLNLTVTHDFEDKAARNTHAALV